jgi:hypothetical protein
MMVAEQKHRRRAISDRLSGSRAAPSRKLLTPHPPPLNLAPDELAPDKLAPWAASPL